MRGGCWSPTMGGYGSCMRGGCWSRMRGPLVLLCRMLTLEHLRRFEHVKVIRGALDIQSWKATLPLLDFFKNVEYIGSQNFSLDTISASGAALSVFVNGNTTRIDLSRLRLVRTGRVLMTGNPGLCYFGDFTTSLSSIYLADPSTQVVRTQNYPFSPAENCGKC